MNKKYVLIMLVFLSLISLVLYEYIAFTDGKMHVIFCSVGQGDAIVIKTPQGHVFLQDGGPDNTVLSCLSRHLPFWHRQLAGLILTHPHADHLNGLLDVLDNYTVSLFITESLTNKTAGYQELVKRFHEHRLVPHFLSAGMSFNVDEVSFAIDGPTREDLASGSPTGDITDSNELASLLVTVKYQSFSVVLTGDSQTKALDEAILFGRLHPATILQVPHHGSATGLDLAALQAVKPAMAVLSVGVNNRYHLPNQKILSLLQQVQVPVVRTDHHGDIEFISDGKQWEVR